MSTVKVRCLELGAADFVAKPFELEELVARVGAHLRRAHVRSAPERHLRAGRLTLDLMRRTVDVGDGAAPVELSEREFGVLRHLMARAGPARARARTCSPTSGSIDFDPHTNVVEVCVHRLRDKLGRGVIADRPEPRLCPRAVTAAARASSRWGGVLPGLRGRHARVPPVADRAVPLDLDHDHVPLRLPALDQRADRGALGSRSSP